MPKDLPVSNGNFLLNFDSDYRIRDIYFPHVGQENHSKGHPSRFGVWADGRFAWIGSEWTRDLRYRDDSLVTNVVLRHQALGLELRCCDAVDFDLNIYLKEIRVFNLEETARHVTLFFAQDFHVYGHDIGDTAYFDPRTSSIVHYNANRFFLVNGGTVASWGVKEFACAVKDHLCEQGSWTDAEDGKLSRNPAAWGFPDSTIAISLDVPPGRSATAFYWVTAGTGYADVTRLNEIVLEKTPAEMIKLTSNYWGAWIQKEPRSFGGLPTEVTDLFNRSLLILRTQIDNRGAIIAANDSDIVRFGKDTYSYMWGRDGAFVAAALAKAGYADVCQRFFNYCADVLSDEGYLMQHYNPDGSLASSWHPWLVDGRQVLPIQEDSTALVLWALWIHHECARDIEFIGPLYKKLVLKSADFLLAHRDPDTHLPLPSFDLWEERYGTHAFTVAAVMAGLRAAANFARLFQDTSHAEAYESAADQMKDGLIRHLYHAGLKRYAGSGYRSADGYDLDEVLDASLLGLTTLGALPANDARNRDTTAAIRQQLWLGTLGGGRARYEGDQYQRPADLADEIPGNPWFISTLWLAECAIESASKLAELHEALPYLTWCAEHALPSGVLAEQVDPRDGSPLSVAPLTWSHSSLVWAIMGYVERFEALRSA